MTPSIIAATSEAEQPMSWEWMAMLLRSTCQKISTPRPP
jgi:hypothetical protein